MQSFIEKKSKMHTMNTKSTIKNMHGFTLVELMIVVLLTAIAVIAIYRGYTAFSHSADVQEQVIEMQQNLRAAMFMMGREIRMAGCNPTDEASAGILTADPNTIRFTMDLHGKDTDDPPDGTTNDDDEDVTYFLQDWNGDGVTDLMRNTPEKGDHPVAESIDALDFIYLNADGNETTDLSQIRTVQITIVARVGKGDPGYSDNITYYNLQDPADPIYTAAGDNFRRRRLGTNIKCRNLGLRRVT